MGTEHIDLNRFIVDRLDASYLWIERLRDGITDEQFYYQPTDDSNSIAWLVWHLSHWRDRTSAIVSGDVEVWISEGWSQRFGMSEDRMGLGDTAEQVTDFRPGRDLVLSYADVAHRAIVDRVLKLRARQLEEQVKGLLGEYYPGYSETPRNTKARSITCEA